MSNLGKIIIAQALKSCPKHKKSSNLVTLVSSNKLFLKGSKFIGSSIVDHRYGVFRPWGYQNPYYSLSSSKYYSVRSVTLFELVINDRYLQSGTYLFRL